MEQTQLEPLTLREKIILFVICLTIIGAAGGAAYLLIVFKDEAQVQEVSEHYALVETALLKKQDKKVIIDAMGTVVPSKQISLKPQVGGRIIALHEEFLEGGIIKKDEVVLEIDPSDYKINLEKAEATLASAQAAFALEGGQQKYAQKEWEILKKSGDTEGASKELILRKPQLQEKLAQLQSAKADVEQAKLNLQRTKVKAPFDAIITGKNVDIGEEVTPQTVLAELANTARYWVEISIPMRDLKWVDMEEKRAMITTNTGVKKEGRVLKLLGEVTEGHLARLLIEVENPRQPDMPILLGEYVSVEISGKTVENVTPIPRTALREGNKIWLMEDGKLKIANVDIVWKNEEYVFISNSFGEKSIVISEISTPVEGMKLKIKE